MAAATMLVVTFAGSETLTFQIGRPPMPGANLRLALMIQLLSAEISWLTPPLPVTGGMKFLNCRP